MANDYMKRLRDTQAAIDSARCALGDAESALDEAASKLTLAEGCEGPKIFNEDAHAAACKLATLVREMLGHETPDDSIEVYNARRALDDFCDACRPVTRVNESLFEAAKAVAA